MKKIFTLRFLLPAFFLLTALLPKSGFGQISLTSSNGTYTQNFDVMGASGTSLPTGWSAIRFAGSGTANAALTPAVDNGSSNSGNIYNVGTTSAGERALGTLASGSTVPAFGASFINNTSAAITGFTLSGVSEQWRTGSSSAVNETVIFEYSLDATSLSSGTWNAVSSLNLVEIQTFTTAAAAIDGNAVSNKTAISGNISSLTLATGSTIWFRWRDLDATGSDGMYALDDFEFTYTNVAASPTVSVAPGTNAAEPSTNGSFTLNFSSPTTASTTISFAYSGTATFTTDYSVSYSTGTVTSPGVLTVPSGTSSVTVTVTPVDDALVEGTETIGFAISAPSGGYTLGTASTSIDLEDDDVPTVSIDGGINAAEPSTNGTFIITLSDPAPAGGVTINYNLAGTATLNSDYSNSQNGTLTITAGNTSGTINITTIDDAIFEGTETIIATLTSANNGFMLATTTATINLIDNETAPKIVINEIYGGGGNSGSVYKNDFIELYNTTNSPVNLNGWSVQYTSSAGTGTWQTTPLTGTIPAKGYYLIQEAAGTGGTTSLPTPDATGTISMSGTAGKVILSSSTTPLTGANPTGAQVIDKVGFGSTATGFETAPAPAPSNTTSIQRKATGLDTDNNSTDFEVLAEPTPKNSVVDITPPVIVATSPADNATGVSTSFIATITFSENVTKGTSGSIILKKISDGSTVQTINVIGSDVTVSGTSVTFSVNSLAFNTAYYFEITTGAFEDLNDNLFPGVTGNTAWNFTTSATPPAGILGNTYNFNTCSGNLPDGFTQFSVLGPQIWSCTAFGVDAAHTPTGSAPNGLQINGFAGGVNVTNEDWLISPSFNLSATTFPLLSFWSRTAFTGASLQLKVSTNYSGTGNPNLATWTDLNGKFPAQVSDVWTLSDNINLSSYKSANTYFAFVYRSTTEDGARWTIDDIKVINSPTPPPPSLTVSAADIQFTFVANGASSIKTFTLTGNDLTGNVTVAATGAFTVSKDGVNFSSTVTYTLAEANNIPLTVSVRFAPTANNQNFTGTVTINTSGLTNTINLQGTSIDPATTLEVVNWNIEWFGSTTLGPTDDNLQEQNVLTVLKNIGADIVGLVEVVSEQRLARVVSQMPGYSYVISNFGSHTNTSANPPSALAEAQKLAFVYKTAMFSNITTSALVSQGINTAADLSNPAYNYFSSGRFPFMMSADVTLNCMKSNVKFVLLHAKANTAPVVTSYNRRKNGADTLHYTLDQNYPNDNIILFGDINDDLDETITTGINPPVSSYLTFLNHGAHFSLPTLALSLAGKKSTVSYNDVIDHVIISNELQPRYLPGSATILTDVASQINKYGSTTTDHYPVFSRYAFPNTIAPVVTSCPLVPAFCAVSNSSYTIPQFVATDDCGSVTYTYAITGATTRNGTTNNASGIFNIGTSVITWMAIDGFNNTISCQTTVVVNPSPVVTIPDAFASTSGVVVNTVYPGFAPAASITLNAVVTNGTAPYTYSWSNGASTPTVTVSPTANTTYMVTVTDAKGCTATATKNIKVINAQGSNPGKLIICHKTRAEPVTIEIDANAITAHLNHGDMLGACSTPNFLTQLQITAAPNPASNFFVITVDGGDLTKRISYKVMNASGNVIERKDNLTTKSFILGANYFTGIYFIEVMQGNERTSMVLIKNSK